MLETAPWTPPSVTCKCDFSPSGAWRIKVGGRAGCVGKRVSQRVRGSLSNRAQGSLSRRRGLLVFMVFWQVVLLTQTAQEKNLWLELFFVFVFVFLLGPYLWLMEVPGLGLESELLLPVYTTATAMQDPSHVCNLHHSSRQCGILNPLSEARD